MGTWTRGEQIVSLLDKLPNDSLLILDEAYAEFAPDEAKVPIFLDDPRMIRFRTFRRPTALRRSDRIWYWNEELIAEFDKIRNHFGNSLLSQVAAIAAIKDQRYLSEIVKNLAWQGGNLPNCSIKRFICYTICDKLCCYRLR